MSSVRIFNPQPPKVLPCGLLGLAVSLHPAWWTTIFSSDAAVLATGALYLHWVGPVYVLLAMGAALYFASQGAGRVLWPVLSASARLVVILLYGVEITAIFARLQAAAERQPAIAPLAPAPEAPQAPEAP